MKNYGLRQNPSKFKRYIQAHLEPIVIVLMVLFALTMSLIN